MRAKNQYVGTVDPGRGQQAGECGALSYFYFRGPAGTLELTGGCFQCPLRLLVSLFIQRSEVVAEPRTHVCGKTGSVFGQCDGVHGIHFTNVTRVPRPG